MVVVSVRFELFVDDVERSVAFCAAVLGQQPQPGFDPRGFGAFFIVDGAVGIAGR